MFLELRILLNKKIIIVFIILICLFTSSTVFAQDNVTCNDDAISLDNESIISASTKPFIELNKAINDNNDANVYLNDDYAYNDNSDFNLKDGIVIDRPLNIFGNNHTISGSNAARIFNIASENVFIKDVIFVNGNSNDGGAITGTNYGVISCTFISNNVINHGGAIKNGNAENCTFIGNVAKYGGAIYEGSAVNCTFESNKADYGGAIYNTYAKDSKFKYNTAFSSSGAMEGSSALNCIFIGNSAKLYGALSKASAQNCTFINNSASGFGGAMGSDSSANDCTFIGNYASEGGAVHMGYVNNCTFIGNHAQYGGAFSGNGNTAENSTFKNNYADEFGGALANVYALNCQFISNHAREGGAMYDNSAVNCTFIDNYATQSGGALKGYAVDCKFINNSAPKAGAIEGSARNSIFEQNHGGTGGAMYGNSAQDCTFKQNYADEGGAIYDGSAVFCQFIENHAKTGGAMYAGSAVNSNFTRNYAQITGGANYKTSLVNCILKDNLPKYKLYVSDFEAIYGFGGKIEIKLSDSSDSSVDNVKTIITIYNSQNNVVGTYNCLSGGTCFVDLDLGKYIVVVTVDDKNYNVDPVTSTITIKTSTFIYVKDVVASYNINNPLIINLHDSKGVVLKNSPVSININGITRTYWTDGNGQILLSTAGLEPKYYNVVINYAGGDKYFKSTASAHISVLKASPFIIVSNMKYFAKKKTKKFYMILKNNLYQPMKGIKVTLKVNGKKFTAKTNSKGRATFKIKKLNKKGKYKVVVSYSGNAYYNAVSKSAKITVKK